MSTKYYVLKITLADVQPEIWRRFVVPADITLDRLHDVIQIVMGWEDAHAHEFVIADKRYTEEPQSPDEGEEEGRLRLGDLVKRAKSSFEYLYDFGDEWRHRLVVEKTLKSLEAEEMPVECLAGERACPPEDVGGAVGYMDFCKAMADPNHPNHAECREWYAGEDAEDVVFLSELFDVEEPNFELAQFLRWSRPRLLPWSVS